MEVSSVNIKASVPVQTSSNVTVKSSAPVSSDSSFKKTLDNTVQSTNKNSTNDTDVKSKTLNSDNDDSSQKVEDKISDAQQPKDETKEESSAKVDDLFLEMAAMLSSCGNGVSIQKIKSLLMPNGQNSMDKIAAAVQNILSKVPQYNQLSDDKKSMVLQNLLNQIKTDLPEKLSLIKTDNTFTNSLKQVISDILTASLKTSTNNSDDELVNSIKNEINNLLKANSEGSSQEVKNAEVPKSALNSEYLASGKQNKGLSSTENVNQELQTDNKADNSKAGIISENVKSEGSNSSTTKDGTNSFTSREEKILKDLTSSEDKTTGLDANNSNNNKDTDSKIQKVTMFSSILSNIKNDNIQVQQSNMYISKANIVNDLIKSLKYMETNNIKDMTVKIVPKELGEVVINITMQDGVMKANLTVNNKEAYNIINSNLSDMNNKLSNQDIKIQNFTVNIYQDSTYFSEDSNKGNSQQQNSKHGNNHSKLAIDDEELDKIQEVDGRVNILA